MIPGFAKSRDELPYLPYREKDKVYVINSHNFGGGAFSPADLSPSLWLDASDSSTLFDAVSGGSLVADGGSVARWEDKSGNNHHATQSAESSRGVFDADGINGIGAITFDGADDFYSADSVASVFSGEDMPISVFAVCKRTTADRQDCAWCFASSTATNPVVSIRSTSASIDGASDKIRSTKRDGVGTILSRSSSVNWGTSPTLIAYLDTGTLATTWADGSVAISESTSDIGLISLDRFTIGQTFLGPVQIHKFLGSICELIALLSVTEAERLQIESYLAAKWGTA
jgi:hypothetical protein